MRDRKRFARLPELCIIGLITGLMTALLMLLFKALIELPALLLGQLFSVASLAELSPEWRLLLPLSGAALLWLYWRREPADARRVGIAHLQEQLSYQSGDLPVRNLINQLIGAALAIGSGHPVGREGPAVHIGAAISSWVGRRLGLPFSYQRLLIGCGAAAAISALFSLPLAGILFAMEVILLEYSLYGFTAIIVSAVSADTLTQLITGHQAALSLNIEPIILHQELPTLIILAVILAVAGACFQQLIVHSTRIRAAQPGLRLILAGALTGLVALLIPDTLIAADMIAYQALTDSLPLVNALTLIAVYLLLTPLIIGLGVPGGVIGPALALGALIGMVVARLLADTSLAIDPTNLALISMAAMMSAVIHAPLAALVAVFELSSNTQTLASAMLVIVVSDLIIRSALGMPSIFTRLLQVRGLSVNTQLYRRVMMSSAARDIMSTAFTLLDTRNNETEQRLIHSQYRWIIDFSDQGFRVLGGGINTDPDLPTWDSQRSHSEQTWYELPVIDERASLQQVLDLMEQQDTHLVGLTLNGQLAGLLDHGLIQKYYQQKAE